MLEIQPEDVAGAGLWELEAAVAPVLPEDAMIQSHLSEPHVLSITARWPVTTRRQNVVFNTAVLRFPAPALRAYLQLHRPKRDAVGEQLRAWFAAIVQDMQATATVDVGVDLHRVVPPAFFLPQPSDL